MKTEKATFAGGCFWCMEPAFRINKGVIDVVAGYSGGEEEDPSYEEVASGKTRHREAVQVVFDAEKTKYEDLLDIFWQSIDPTDFGGQFADRGFQYKTAIFYHNEEQKKAAMKSKKDLADSGKFKGPIATEIIKFKNFYPAEQNHQGYYRKNPMAYKMYKIGSGRAGFLKDAWGKK